MNQIFKNLTLSFELEHVLFRVPSICLELLTKPMPMHSHGADSYEIHYISEGYGTLTTAFGTFDITPGTLYVTGPEAEHEQVSDSGRPMLEYCVYLQLVRKDISRNASPLLSPFLSQTFWLRPATAVVDGCMKEMIHELVRRDNGYSYAVCSLLERFVLELCRILNSENTGSFPSSSLSAKVPEHEGSFFDGSSSVVASRDLKVSDEKSKKNHPSAVIQTGDTISLAVEEAFLYHYDTLTLSELSKRLGLGTRQTERYLFRTYGKSFQQKKTEARMNAAVIMLRNTDTTIAAIAGALGYSSAEHFSDAFRNYFHRSPSAFRKSAEK